MEVLKRCAKCKEKKGVDNFCKHKRNKDGLNHWCKVCAKISTNNYLKSNPNTPKNGHLLREYRITLSQYNEMFQTQDGKCALCGAEENSENKKLVLDHCHYTDRIRGLLCDRCNTGIGMLKLDLPSDMLEKLKAYLWEELK